MKKSMLLPTLCLLLSAGIVAAADWPQWRGPGRDGISAEKGLLASWPKAGPELAWTYEAAGNGYGGPAVVGGTVYVMGARQDTECLIALDQAGKERWATPLGPVFDFKTNAWSRGPNGTPTVDGDRIYALGSQGDLVCASASDGAPVWRKDLPRELGAEVNPVGGGPDKMGWGFSWSPLVDGDKLICTPGGPQGLLAALDKKTGAVLWRSKEATDQATYSSPVVADVGGVRQYVQMTQDGVVGVSAADGQVLWTYKRDNPYPDVVCPTPVVQGDKVYVTAGWGGGCDLLQLAPDGKKFKVTAVYSEKEIGNRQGCVVLVGKHVYGYHEERAWECQEFATGTVKWASKRNALKAGAVIYADGHLYCLAENGVVGLLRATPEKHEEVSRFSLPKQSATRKVRGGVWTPPVLSDGRLYLRDQELVFCYKIK